MKKMLRFSTLAVLGAGLLFTSCKKDEPSTTADPETVAMANNADDEATASGETDASLADADEAINLTAIAGGRVAATLPCGVASIDSFPAEKRYVITFDGRTRCGNRQAIRSGSITLQLFNAQSWADAGAVMSVTYDNYAVRKGVGRSAGNAIVLNGSGKIYNVLGGLRRQVLRGTANQVQHRIRFSNLRMAYKNRLFTDIGIAKTRTWVNEGGFITIQVTGDTAGSTLGGNSNVGHWGTNRQGVRSYTIFQQPVVANNNCGFDAPVSGVKVHKGLNRELTVTFGVDRQGNPVTGSCPYGYKYQFVGPRRTETGVVEY